MHSTRQAVREWLMGKLEGVADWIIDNWAREPVVSSEIRRQLQAVRRIRERVRGLDFPRQADFDELEAFLVQLDRCGWLESPRPAAPEVEEIDGVLESINSPTDGNFVHLTDENARALRAEIGRLPPSHLGPELVALRACLADMAPPLPDAFEAPRCCGQSMDWKADLPDDGTLFQCSKCKVEIQCRPYQ